jgi:hypothetical protein
MDWLLQYFEHVMQIDPHIAPLDKECPSDICLKVHQVQHTCGLTSVLPLRDGTTIG